MAKPVIPKRFALVRFETSSRLFKIKAGSALPRGPTYERERAAKQPGAVCRTAARMEDGANNSRQRSRPHLPAANSVRRSISADSLSENGAGSERILKRARPVPAAL